ncbi:MAG TPA: hypothetical protein VI306_06300 [Pyrinomonadaceae bacterium]
MKRATLVQVAAILLIVSFTANVGQAINDDFSSVVKMIEQYYNVKHEGLSFLAKAAMKAVGTGAKIKGGTARQLAEAGSIRLATFEDQDFNGDFLKFRSSLNDSLKDTWTPLVQTISSENAEQSYIFVREKGDKFSVLIVMIEKREGTVVQATVSAKSLALLMKDPEEGAKTIREEATIVDNE